MATLEQAIYARMTGFAEVSALVSTRIYPLFVPQEVANPAIAYQRISGMPYRSHQGFSGLSRARFQFTCQGETVIAAKALAVAVRHCFESLNATVAGVKLNAFVENELDSDEEAAVVRVDVMILHNAE